MGVCGAKIDRELNAALNAPANRRKKGSAPNHVLLNKDPDAWVQKDLKEQGFQLREPVVVSFCFESLHQERV